MWVYCIKVFASCKGASEFRNSPLLDVNSAFIEWTIQRGSANVTDRVQLLFEKEYSVLVWFYVDPTFRTFRDRTNADSCAVFNA